MAEILIQPTLPQLSQPQFSNDAPEEVLRSEIYTDANSPIDGTRLTAVEYTILMENLASVDYIPPEQKVSKKLRNVVELLKLRQQVRSIAPFLLRWLKFVVCVFKGDLKSFFSCSPLSKGG